MKIFRVIFLCAFLSLVIAIGLLESTPGKKYAQKMLLQSLAKSGIQVDVETLSGNLPYQVHLTKVKFDQVSFEEVDIEISLIYLLKRELYIKSLRATGFHYEPSANSQMNVNSSSRKLPIAIRVHHFHIEGDLNLDGDAKLRRNGSGHLDVVARDPQTADATLSTSLSWTKYKVLDAHVKIDTPTLDPIARFASLPFNGSLKLDLKAKGTVDAFKGQASGHFHRLDASSPYLDSDWNLATHFHKDAASNLEFQQLLISSDAWRFQGSAKLDTAYNLQKVDGEIRAQIPEGLIFATGTADKGENGYEVDLNAKSESINIEGQHFVQVTASVKGLLVGDTFIGTDKVVATYLDEAWEATSSIALRPRESLIFDDIDLKSKLADATGQVALRIPELIFVGKFDVKQADLQILNRLKLTPLFYGNASGTLAFDENGLYTDFAADNILFQSTFADHATFFRDNSHLVISAQNIRSKTLLLDSASLDWNGKQVNLSANGTFIDPMDVNVSATLYKIGDEWKGNLTNVAGTIFHEPIYLEQPASFSKSKDLLYCAPVSVHFGEGVIDFDFLQTPRKTDASIHLTKVPLDLLSVNPLEVPVGGNLYLKGNIYEENGVSTGTLRARIEDGLVSIQGSSEPIHLRGDLTADFVESRLKGSTNLIINDAPYLALDYDIPIKVDTRPFSVHPILDQKVAGNLSLHGKIEEIIDFYNLGTHRIEGNIDCEMTLSGKLNRPRLQGACAITDGHYQNYLTGTELSDLSGTLLGKGDQLVLESFTGNDLNYGKCMATGQIKLNPSEAFPFKFDAEFKDLTILQLDLIHAEAIGKVQIEGNFNKAEAKGFVEVLDCQVQIPDKIPRSFPELQVVYKNAPYSQAKKDEPKKQPFPLKLDLTVNSPNAISITGRGLNSDWKGSFNVEGTYLNPSVKGKLQLINGEFVFAGKQFKLLDGSVSMFGQSYETPQIDIAANTSEKGISITARIKGPVNAPQITFQSSPPLPLSGIISYLIFGKDLSEVSGIQALQLASTIATVAGEGPDILEMTRKSLGVDRLQIVMTPSSMDDGADTLTLEVGKIIFPGFLLTVRQGAEDSSPNIKIEVDLSGGFTLGLESVQQLEEGKFSLNWNINY